MGNIASTRALEVAVHPVGRRKQLKAAVGFKKKMRLCSKEEAVDDRDDADVVGHPRHPRPQAADAAHDEVDLHPACEARQGADDIAPDSAFILAMMRRASRAGVLRLGFDEVDDALAQPERPNR